MAPNMCQWVMNLPMPWVWFRHKVRAVSCLHCHSEPIPGIYLSHPEGWFLVAMKPNSVKRDSNFFKMQVALSEDEEAVYMENGLTVCPSWQLDRDVAAMSYTDVCTTQSIYSTIDSSSEDDITIDPSSARRVRFVLPTPEPRCGQWSVKNKSQQKSPLRQCANTSNGPEGTLPNGRKCRKYHPHIFKRFHKGECPLRSIDIVGFRYLNNPLKIEYSPYLERWMFSAELHKRTIIAEVCEGGNCTHLSDSSCKKNKVHNQFTLLDDGLTWLLTGDIAKNGRITQRKNIKLNLCPLYAILTQNMHTLRKLTNEEAASIRLALKIIDRRFLRWEGEPNDYAMALKGAADRRHRLTRNF